MKTLIILFLLVSSAYSQVDPFDYLGGQKLEADTAHNYFIPTTPEIPTLQFPLTSSLNISDSDTLEWSASNGTGYDVRIWNRFGDTINSFSTTDTFKAFSTLDSILPKGYKFFWKVRATNGVVSSNYSSTFDFKLTTIADLLLPTRTEIMVGYFQPYNPIEYIDASSNYKLFANKKIYESVDGLSFTFVDSTTSFVDQIWSINDDRNYFGFHHRLINPFYYYAYLESTNNGVTWDTTGDIVTFDGGYQKAGEDITMCLDTYNNIFYYYFRDSTTQDAAGVYWDSLGGNAVQCPLRTISVATTNSAVKADLIAPTGRQVVIPATRSNFHNTNSKDYRVVWNNMSTKFIDTDFWGFASTIHQRADAHENIPGSTADTVDIRLYYSANGTTFKCLNDSDAVIPLTSPRKQIFAAAPVVVGDSMFIYTEELSSRHNNTDGTAANIRIYRYAIALAKLNLYKP